EAESKLAAAEAMINLLRNRIDAYGHERLDEVVKFYIKKLDDGSSDTRIRRTDDPFQNVSDGEWAQLRIVEGSQ
ncbi:hypothetical protein OC842_008049, partial [Tilletia horrida]